MIVSFRKRIMIGWSVVAAFVALALAGTTAFGASPPPAPAATQSANQARVGQSAITKLDPYVARLANGTLALNAPSSVTRSVGAATMKQLRSGMALVNREIRAGNLVATANHRLYDPKAGALSIQGGWTGIRWYWWGFDLYLNEAYTQRFIQYISYGVSILGACMLVPALANQVACAALAAAFGLFGTVIAIIDWRGNGVVFDKQWWSIGTFYAQ